MGDGERMEIIELDNHPYYVAVQFHPEYISRPLKPSPPYLGLILAASGKLQNYISQGCNLNSHRLSFADSEDEGIASTTGTDTERPASDTASQSEDPVFDIQSPL